MPTRDRPDALRRCLAALAVQDVEELEVVVVDDGSRDRAGVSGAVAILPTARLIRSPGRGPAAARNLGVRAAEGELVCFTDDDCEPEPGWGRLLAAAVAAAPGRVTAGRTIAPPQASAPVAASQAITNQLLLASLSAEGDLGFAPTCNLCCARELLTALPFDSSYPDAAGEDRDWWARAVGAGIVARYEPRALVVHRQILDAPGFWRQQFRYGRGAARFRAGARERRVARPSFYAGLVRRGFADGAAVGGLVLAAQAATAAGVVAERLSRPGRKGG